MNPTDAIKLMVRHIPGGWDSVAPLCGKSAETLRHAFSGDGRFVPSVIDACTISEHAISINSPHCHAFANAVAANCGGFVSLSVRDPLASRHLAGDTAGMLKECSDVVSKVTESLADGVISDNDRKAIERELAELIAALQKVQQDVHAAHEQGKSLRAV